jgi:DNA-binding GntR family transcriptional regulator
MSTQTVTRGRDRSSAGVQCYEVLRDAIVSLRLEPGERISDVALAAELGVSRTPVREAVLQLAGEGLVEVIPQRGTFVAPISLEAVREAQFLREALELAALREAVDRIGEPELAELDANLAAQRDAAAAADAARFYALDEEFHRRLVEYSGFPGAWRVARRSRAHLDRARVLSLPGREVIRYLVTQHSEIVERLRAHDRAGVEELMRDHLRRVYRDLPELERTHPDYFAQPPTPDPIAAARGAARHVRRREEAAAAER